MNAWTTLQSISVEIKKRLQSLWKNSNGLWYMLIAQILTAAMTTATKFQEETMSPFEVGFLVTSR